MVQKILQRFTLTAAVQQRLRSASGVQQDHTEPIAAEAGIQTLQDLMQMLFIIYNVAFNAGLHKFLPQLIPLVLPQHLYLISAAFCVCKRSQQLVILISAQRVARCAGKFLAKPVERLVLDIQKTQTQHRCHADHSQHDRECPADDPI